MNPFHWLFDKLYPLIRYVYESVQGHPWFDKISPQLWIGGAPTYKRDYIFLEDENINAILDLRAERSGDTDFFTQNDIDYLRLPVLDVTVPSDDELDRGVGFIKGHVDNGATVLVHCAKGRGRSATLMAAFLMKHEGYSFEEAQQFLVSKRSLVQLQGRHQRALENWMNHQEPLTPTDDDPAEKASGIEQTTDT